MCLMNENFDCLRREHAKRSVFKFSGENSLSAVDITDRLTGQMIVLISNIKLQIPSVISYQLILTCFVHICLASLFCYVFLCTHVCELPQTKLNLTTARETDMF